MERCAACGAALPSGSAWCGQCYAAVTSTAAPSTGGFVPTGAAARAVAMRTTRWGKTPTTFGPIGRVLATIAVFVPLALMIVGGFAVTFSWGGAVVYAGIIVPWAMRDIWEAGRIVVADSAAR